MHVGNQTRAKLSQIEILPCPRKIAPSQGLTFGECVADL